MSAQDRAREHQTVSPSPEAPSTAVHYSGEYVVDTRPLCQGMPFALTDAAHPRLVLKHGSHFLVLDESGAIPACNTLGYGYYRYDTRHLSQYELSLSDAPLSLLSSDVEEGYAGSFLYTNVQTSLLPLQKITLLREVVLSDLWWERLELTNFHNEVVDCELSLTFGSDFADMFEVRGLNRAERGKRMLPLAGRDGKSLYLAYAGQDGMLLETVFDFFGLMPSRIEEGRVVFQFHLPVKQSATVEMCVSTRWDRQVIAADSSKTSFLVSKQQADDYRIEWHKTTAEVKTENELFDLTLKRAYRDIYILRQPSPKGTGLAAGIPWYAAVFGRDSAITARQVLPFMPQISKECLDVLAAYQGQVTDHFREEYPGRIMHELRLGELARAGMIPHQPYFGTVDATQLWCILLCEYINWTGNLEYARHMWPYVKAAVAWLDDTTGGGYICYAPESDQSLVNQGWKDSGDSVMHPDGTMAHPPIAICEAQGYLFAARMAVAQLAQLLGHAQMADELRGKALKLKEEFQRDFWMEEERYLALALDGYGRQVKVLSSNPGHCLATGILDDDKSSLVADKLMGADLHSGWGIRTLAGSTVAYSPISYHNGSVWPHDNAMIAEGLRKIGRIADVHRIMLGLFEIAQHERDFQLPELICGFERNRSAGPIDYPVSCSPQAWAAGSMFQLLSCCINFQPDALNNRLRIVEPCLPDWLEKVTVRGLRIGNSILDLSFSVSNGFSSCQVLRKFGNIKLIVEN